MGNDSTTQVREAHREVRKDIRGGQPVHVVVLRQTYAAEIDDVWDACTNAERLPRWFLPVTGNLEVGGRFQFDGNAGGEVRTCDKPTLAAVTWEFGGEVSWLELRLSEQPGPVTTLELEHTASVDPDRWQQFGPGAVGVGWDLALTAGLGSHLETGATVDPLKAQEWTGAAEGVAFITRSSEDWCRASIESGEDTGAAREAAARTLAFYTGTTP